MGAGKKGRIFSGMRPTGPLHLGHLVGALKNWAALQDDYECIFGIVDWHAFMSEYKSPATVTENIAPTVADWIACGIDPERSTIMVQSDVPEHLELFMLFSAVTDLLLVILINHFQSLNVLSLKYHLSFNLYLRQ